MPFVVLVWVLIWVAAVSLHVEAVGSCCRPPLGETARKAARWGISCQFGKSVSSGRLGTMKRAVVSFLPRRRNHARDHSHVVQLSNPELGAGQHLQGVVFATAMLLLLEQWHAMENLENRSLLRWSVSSTACVQGWQKICSNEFGHPRPKKSSCQFAGNEAVHQRFIVYLDGVMSVFLATLKSSSLLLPTHLSFLVFIF